MPSRARKVELRLTPAQLDALISVLELTLDGAPFTFAAWLETNGSRQLRVVERQLRQAEGESPRAVVALCPECKGRGQLALITATIPITAKCAACNGTGRA